MRRFMKENVTMLILTIIVAEMQAFCIFEHRNNFLSLNELIQIRIFIYVMFIDHRQQERFIHNRRRDSFIPKLSRWAKKQ